MTISKSRLMVLLIENNILKKLMPLKLLLSMPIDSDFIMSADKGYNIVIGDNTYFVETDNTLPLLVSSDVVTMPAHSMSIIDKDIETTVGRVIVNYIISEVGLEGNVKFLNKMFTYGSIEKEYIIPNLSNEGKPGDIPVRLLKKVANSVFFLRNLADVITIPSTEKSLLPPKDLQQRKLALAKVYDEKYGDWKSVHRISLMFDEELMSYYKEYLKDDPTYGITTSGKVVNASLKRRFVSQGNQSSLSGKDHYIMSSLSEGAPKTKEDIAAAMNGTISGVASRGLGTQIGGVMAKVLISALHGYVIEQADCKTKDTIDYFVTEDVSKLLIGLYHNIGTTATLITRDGANKLIGKTIKLRTTLYCKSKGASFCKTCAGKELSKVGGGVALYAIMTGGSSVKYQLSKFHTVDLQLMTISKDDLL